MPPSSVDPILIHDEQGWMGDNFYYPGSLMGTNPLLSLYPLLFTCLLLCLAQVQPVLDQLIANFGEGGAL